MFWSCIDILKYFQFEYTKVGLREGIISTGLSAVSIAWRAINKPEIKMEIKVSLFEITLGKRK